MGRLRPDRHGLGVAVDALGASRGMGGGRSAHAVCRVGPVKPVSAEPSGGAGRVRARPRARAGALLRGGDERRCRRGDVRGAWGRPSGICAPAVGGAGVGRRVCGPSIAPSALSLAGGRPGAPGVDRAGGT